jgi:putative FmdB family regulatory protein
MPIYEYQCEACDHKMEKLQKLSDEPLKVCPICNELRLNKLVSAAGFRLKGEGWYETDFKTGKKKNVAGDNPNTTGSSGSSSSDSGSSSSSSSSSDSSSSSGSGSGTSSKSSSSSSTSSSKPSTPAAAS